MDLRTLGLEVSETPREVDERLVDMEELELGPQPTEPTARGVVHARTSRAGVELSEPGLGDRDDVVDGSREQPVEQQEFDRRRRLDRPLVRPDVRLVGRAAPQRRRPGRAVRTRRPDGRTASASSCRPARGFDRASRSATRRHGSWSRRRCRCTRPRGRAPNRRIRGARDPRPSARAAPLLRRSC